MMKRKTEKSYIAEIEVADNVMSTPQKLEFETKTRANAQKIINRFKRHDAYLAGEIIPVSRVVLSKKRGKMQEVS